MRRCRDVMVVLALLTTSCAGAMAQDPPSGQTRAHAEPSATSNSATVATVPDPMVPPRSAATTSATTTIPPLTVGAGESDIVLRPPLYPGESLSSGTVYFAFTEVSGVDSYTARSSLAFDDGRQREEMVRELLVAGDNAHIRSEWNDDVSEIALAEDGNAGIWVRRDHGPWEEIEVGSGSLAYSLYSEMYFLSPDTVHQLIHPLIHQLTFVEWSEGATGDVAHFSGDVSLARALVDAEEDGAVLDQAADGGIDVWLDGRGFVSAYSVAIRTGAAVHIVEWELSDLGATAIELPG